jgi:hypothetical protein
MTTRRNPLPEFERLPLNEGDPPNSAWGLWDDTNDASLGSLNYLTDDVVLRAVREEVKTGERTGLEYVLTSLFIIAVWLLSMASLPLDFFKPPLLGRAGFEQKVIDKSPLVVNDDVVRLFWVDFDIHSHVSSELRSRSIPKEVPSGTASGTSRTKRSASFTTGQYLTVDNLYLTTAGF